MIELVKVGVFDSSMKFKNTDQTPDRYSECYEIELYLSGNGQTFIDDTGYDHKKNNLIFVRPGQKRYSRKYFTCFFIYVVPDKETEKLLRDVPLLMNVGNSSQYKNCFNEIIQETEKESADQLFIQSKIYELLSLITKEKGEVGSEAVHKAMIYIDENYHENIKLKDVAENVYLSPSYFHRLFKEYTGKTPAQYILEKRLSNAKKYLLSTNYSLNEIVDKCGFSSVSYFDFQFKKNLGITPMQYRNRKYTSLETPQA